MARRLAPLEGASTAAGTGSPAPLAVAGTEGLLVSYAHCCYPIPDDPILAFLSSGRGIVIHRETCANVEDYRKRPENWLPVAWQANPKRQFLSEIRISVINRVGMLAALSAAIAATQTNINMVTIEQRDPDVSVVVFVLEVRDRLHLAQVMRTVRRMPDVLKVTRTIATQLRKKEDNAP